MVSKYFTADELSCQHCGKEKFDKDFLKVLNALREDCNFPFPVTSGYRCAELNKILQSFLFNINGLARESK